MSRTTEQATRDEPAERAAERQTAAGEIARERGDAEQAAAAAAAQLATAQTTADEAARRVAALSAPPDMRSDEMNDIRAAVEASPGFTGSHRYPDGNWIPG